MRGAKEKFKHSNKKENKKSDKSKHLENKMAFPNASQHSDPNLGNIPIATNYQTSQPHQNAPSGKRLLEGDDHNVDEGLCDSLSPVIVVIDLNFK